jgi:hypothetical protein
MVYYNNRIKYMDSFGGLILDLFNNPNIYLYDKLKECKDLYNELKMNGLVFDNELYHPDNNVDIIQEFPRVETLEVTASHIKNLDGIKFAPDLKHLTLFNGSKFDFYTVKDTLKHLHFSYHKNIINLDRLEKLEELIIYNDNNDVKIPININELRLIKSKRTNLIGLKKLENIKNIEIDGCSKLLSLEGLPTGIERIVIYSGINLTNLDALFLLENPKGIVVRSKHSFKEVFSELETKFPNAGIDFRKT